MSNAKHGRVWISAVLMFLSLPAHAQSGSDHRCSESPGFYERGNYIVHEVRIEAPLDWLLGSVSQKLRNILSDASMPIRKGNVFRKADSDAGFIKLTDNFPELTVSPIDRVAVRLAAPGLENCDKKARTLDVVYRVYTFGFSYYLSRAFESGGKEEVRRSVVETPATERFADYFPQPFIGYNRSRDFYGGTRLAIKLPGGLLDKISLGASGSSSSVEAGAAAEGSRSYNKSSIRQLEYQFRYSYSDIPAKSLKLKESTVLGQVFAATRAFGPQELILRFGGSFEGGNKHTGDQRSTSAADLANSGYGSLKAFVGGTLRSGMQAFKGSYGVQLGSAAKGTSLDYVKQLVDTAASLRFPLGDHKPISIDLQFTAGSIHTRGQLPVGERFFGGNVDRNFIAGNAWVIRSNPFIRSFSQNSFAQADAANILGGDSFFSANVTVAATVWGKPLVPREILDEPDFPNLMGFEFSAAESALRNEYLSGTPEFRQVAELVGPLSNALRAVHQELEAIVKQKPGQDITDQISSCNTDLNIADTAADAIKKDLENGAAKTADIRKLVVGFPTKTPPIPAYVSDLVDDLNTLKDITGLPSPNHLEERTAELEDQRQRMASAFLALDKSPVADLAERNAQRDMKYPRRVFDQLTREANLIAVGPVIVLDAARLWQHGLAGDVRYAAGGGIRLSIVSLDVTAGYAWNPHPKPWESRGALLFSMEVSNLFR